MATHKRSGPSDEELLELHEEFGGNISAIAYHLNRPRQTVAHWYNNQLGVTGDGIPGPNSGEKLKEILDSRKGEFEFPDFEDKDVEVDKILDYMSGHFKALHHRKTSWKWFPIKMNIDGPIGLSFIGDPHLGDNGCNVPLVRDHVDILSNTEALYAINIGDTANNWLSGSRLEKLYAKQDSSRETERKLADWFLNDAGINWLVWLMGNHDMWGEFSEILRGYNIKKIPMEDWQAQFKLVFPNGKECKIWAAHDFKGHSMWNSLHGPQKAAHLKAQAHIYAAGHTHNWAMHQEESASRDFTYWLIRSRGYKFVDEYADLLGHFPQQEGASITAIIDPEAKSMAGFVQCYADMEHASDYLSWLRARR